MKRTNKIWIGLAAVAFAVTGCSQGELVGDKPEGEGTLIVNLGSPAESRGIIDGLLTDAIVDGYEKNITEAIVYVVNNSTGVIIAAKTTDATNKAVFQGLTATTEVRVVAVANGNNAAIAQLAVGADINDLQDDVVLFTSQMVANFSDLTKGFLMTGEYDSDGVTDGVQPYTIPAGSASIEVPVRRLVAKVEMGAISYGSNLNLLDIMNFNISSMGIQKAISVAYAGLGNNATIPTAPTPEYYGHWGTDLNGGAIVSDASNTAIADALGHNGAFDATGIVDDIVEASGLLTAITDALTPLVLTLSPVFEALGISGLSDITANGLDVEQLTELLNNQLTGAVVRPILNVTLGTLSGITNIVYDPASFFYVLPNPGTPQATLLTLKGNFDGTDYYYPIAINAVDKGGATGTEDGTFITRNMRYIINVEFDNLVGNINPDDPTKTPGITVTVVPVAWEGPITQDTVW